MNISLRNGFSVLVNRFLFAAVAVPLLCSGCTRYVYEIEMSVEEGKVRRTLEVDYATENDPLPEEEQQRLAELYGQELADSEQSVLHFSALFSEKMPNDVGGAGSWTTWTSPMGEVSFYLERFRGEDDLTKSLERQWQAIDELSRLTTGWLTESAPDPQDRKLLQDFVQNDLREDLRSLALYRIAFDADFRRLKKQDEIDQFRAHVVQFLLERDYLTTDLIPQIHLAFSQESPEMRLEVICKIFDQKLSSRASRSVKDMVPVLNDPELLSESWKRFVETTEAYRQSKQAQEVSSPIEFLWERLRRAAHIHLLDHDMVRVSFHTDLRPVATNGEWLKEEAAVEWEIRPSLPGSPDLFVLPAVHYMVLSHPSEDYQRKRFGRVILEGRSLARYMLWYRGLSDQDRAEWDRLLEGFTPETDHIAVLKRFQFSTAKPFRQDGTVLDLADRGRTILYEALQ